MLLSHVQPNCINLPMVNSIQESSDIKYIILLKFNISA
jgi:hypothetical protein